MARACIASINLEAIKRNYLYAKSLAPNSQAIAIVKANAYGHGAVEVATHLQDTVDAFGVACTEEAIEIRGAGLEKKPILLLEGMFEQSELELLEKYQLLPVIGNQSQLQWILDAKLKNPTKVFVKYDSGMSRLGFHKGEFKQALKALEASNNISDIVLMTHFSKADEPYDISTQNQIDNFNRIANETGHPSSIANSAGIVAWRNSHKQYNRPGIMLYGSSPFTEARYQKNLVPAMTLSSVLISIKSFKKGQGIGYGSRFICKQDMQIGVVAVGYADGYSRHAKDGTPVFINNTRSRIVGRVSMDMTTIDLTNVPNPKIGDRVEMFGENIGINEVAEFSNTISYEILTKITKRVYINYIT
ncbi:MAG TPA: alanine racemase [Candidatus Thioglobus sp.]|nr:alanine racemase [Candidatus Thioglobus sp.]